LDAPARQEADPGLERVAIGIEGRNDIPEVVGVVELEAETFVPARRILVPVVDEPAAGEEVLVLHEARGLVDEVEAGERVLRARRAAVREDEADLALGQDVLGNAGSQEVLGGKAVESVSPDVEDLDVGGPELAEGFRPEGDRDLPAFEKPDPAAEERREAAFRARRPEVEDLRAFQEECPFFREVEGEPGQVDLAFVALDLGEVHVIAEGADEVGREVLVKVEAAVPGPVGRLAGLVVPGGAGQAVGLERQA